MPDSSFPPPLESGYLTAKSASTPRFTDTGWARGLAIVMSIAAAALFVVALGKPWWLFKLYAPQYPHSLTLVISLSGLSGDVREIDMLNHYIGMAHIDAAAVFERHYASVAVYALGATLIALTLVLKGASARFIAVLGALFPLGFIADSFVWLYRFGHELDPRAPLHLPKFTPQLFGNGMIGQFMTFATPQSGFWLAVAGVALLLGPVILLGGAASKRRSTKLRSPAPRGYA
jgi:copper chaperone NosL